MADQDRSDDRQLEDRLRRAFQWMADHDDGSGSPVAPPAGARATGATAGTDHENEAGLYLDEPTQLPPSRRSGRTVVLAAAAVVLLVAVGVPVGLVATSSGPHGSGPRGRPGMTESAARAQVVSALSATTSAGNWDISYTYGEVPGSAPTPSTTTPMTSPCPEPSSVGCGVATFVAPDPQGVTVSGTGIIDVNPKAMVTSADVSNFGHVVLRVDPTQVWEILSGDSGGLAPDPGGSQGAGQALSQGAGQALSQYA
ncbi:MAG TPA: hypothetical protein VHZ02_12900, partial [Acidimicrobiales bacterium]|nr:hypothetical protein [Acidimicrobiales bacterium]